MIRDLTVTADEDVAFCDSLNRLTATPLCVADRFDLWFCATVCLREVDGSWRITHEHNSTPCYMEGSFRAAVDPNHRRKQPEYRSPPVHESLRSRRLVRGFRRAAIRFGAGVDRRVGEPGHRGSAGHGHRPAGRQLRRGHRRRSCTTFYAGDFLRGDSFRGNVHRGTAEPFIDAPDGRMAVGMAVNLAHGLPFVAGGFGQAYVYDTRTGATVASYQFADPAASVVNDVAVTRDRAWFTDSLQAQLCFVPVSRAGVPGPSRTLALSGPAADTSGDFNLNGIQAAPTGRTLIVAHSLHGKLYTIDPSTGASALIAGVDVPNVDGIVLQGRRLWAVQHANNPVSRFRLSADLRRGALSKVTESTNFASRPRRRSLGTGSPR